MCNKNLVTDRLQNVNSINVIFKQNPKVDLNEIKFPKFYVV